MMQAGASDMFGRHDTKFRDVKLAVGGPHGAPVVRNSERAASRPGATVEIPEALGGGYVEWALPDSNRGPIGYEPTALTAELRALTKNKRATG